MHHHLQQSRPLLRGRYLFQFLISLEDQKPQATLQNVTNENDYEVRCLIHQHTAPFLSVSTPILFGVPSLPGILINLHSISNSVPADSTDSQLVFYHRLGNFYATLREKHHPQVAKVEATTGYTFTEQYPRPIFAELSSSILVQKTGTPLHSKDAQTFSKHPVAIRVSPPLEWKYLTCTSTA